MLLGLIVASGSALAGERTHIVACRRVRVVDRSSTLRLVRPPSSCFCATTARAMHRFSPANASSSPFVSAIACVRGIPGRSWLIVTSVTRRATQ